MRKIRVGRLRKLIRFLNQLEPEKFDFTGIINPCKTVGCAIGWTPVVFPHLVSYHIITQNVASFYFLKEPDLHFYQIASKLFNLHTFLADFLFSPNYQKQVHTSLNICRYDAKPKEVANMLTQFIQLVKENKIEGHCL